MSERWMWNGAPGSITASAPSSTSANAAVSVKAPSVTAWRWAKSKTGRTQPQRAEIAKTSSAVPSSRTRPMISTPKGTARSFFSSRARSSPSCSTTESIAASRSRPSQQPGWNTTTSAPAPFAIPALRLCGWLAAVEAAARCAVVTGAATGIGRATAHALARGGYSVALVGRRAEPLEQVADELRKSGAEAIAAPADVAAREEAAAAIGAAVERFGGIDALVNNAGVGDSAPLLEEPLERWEETLRINLTGAFVITQLALPHLIERRGAVVNVASVKGILAGPGWTSYCV